jgi:hypothetical protein
MRGPIWAVAVGVSCSVGVGSVEAHTHTHKVVSRVTWKKMHVLHISTFAELHLHFCMIAFVPMKVLK